MRLKREDILRGVRSAGITVDETLLKVESCKERTVVHLDHDRIAWFPQNPEGRAAIENERRMLRLIEKYCRFRAPRILYEDAEVGTFERWFRTSLRPTF